MVPPDLDDELLEALAALSAGSFAERVWRHTFADYPPDRANVRGARWNPPGVEALYASLERQTALAEAEHLIAMQPIRPRAKRFIHLLEIRLANVLDLTGPIQLRRLELSPEAISAPDLSRCQAVGAAAAFLNHDGLLVPSARHSGTNLVILVANTESVSAISVVSSDPVDDLGKGSM